MLVNPIVDEYFSEVFKIEKYKVKNGLFITKFDPSTSIFKDKVESIFTFDDDEYIMSFGICDNFEQVLNKYEEYLNIKDRYFFIVFNVLDPDTNIRKCGPYIGLEEYPIPDKHYQFSIYEVFYS